MDVEPINDALCPACRGTGRDPMSDITNWLPCKRCDGTGRYPDTRDTPEHRREARGR